MGFDDDFIATGNTKEEVMNKALSHGKSEHGIKDSDVTPEFRQKVESKIAAS
jgi:predicted small metal-binding protein